MAKKKNKTLAKGLIALGLGVAAYSWYQKGQGDGTAYTPPITTNTPPAQQTTVAETIKPTKNNGAPMA